MNRVIRLSYSMTNKINNKRFFSKSYSRRNIKYTGNEEWLHYNDNNKNNIKVGLTKNACEQLGEIVYIDFPYEINDKIEKDDEIVIIESVKATDSVKAPIDGIIKNMNISICDDLDKLNKDPECFESSWLISLSAD